MTSFERYAVIGDPIAHSLSPIMQTAALRAAGMGATYEAVHVRPADLGRWVASARRDYRGFNVTIPHKEAVAKLVDELSPGARAVGATNTVVCGDRLSGHNTDVSGFAAAVASLGIELKGRFAVVFGAGGSARAVAQVLADDGAEVRLAARTPARAEAIAQIIRSSGGRSVSIDVLESSGPELNAAVEEAILLVNATPMGMSHLPHGNPLPEDAQLRHQPAVIDLVYGRETPLQCLARAEGCVVMDGIEMLVRQGAKSFEIWTGKKPDLQIMRRACREELARR